jgi:hypothetical protein
MRTLLIACLFVFACGDDNLAGVGQPCISSGDCAAGLLCDFGKKPHVCEPETTLKPDLSMMGDLAGEDLAGEDLAHEHD